MTIEQIRKNIYPEDIAICWVNLTEKNIEVSISYISKILYGKREVNSDLSKTVYDELVRLAKANIRATAEKKNLPIIKRA